MELLFIKAKIHLLHLDSFIKIYSNLDLLNIFTNTFLESIDS